MIDRHSSQGSTSNQIIHLTVSNINYFVSQLSIWIVISDFVCTLGTWWTDDLSLEFDLFSILFCSRNASSLSTSDLLSLIIIVQDLYPSSPDLEETSAEVKRRISYSALYHETSVLNINSHFWLGGVFRSWIVLQRLTFSTLHNLHQENKTLVSQTSEFKSVLKF